MSKALVQLRRARRRKEVNDLPIDERRALSRMRMEAAHAGATLRNPEGGLPSSLALGVYRRDEWRCKRCGERVDLVLHHKGGAAQAKRWASSGTAATFNNLVTVCASCHNAIHDESRELTNAD